MGKTKYPYVAVKVDTRTKERLDAVCKKYRFKSNYEILQYILGSFLRYAAPDVYIAADREEVDQLGKMFAEAKNVKGPAKNAWKVHEDKKPAYIICSYNVGKGKNAYVQCVRFSGKGRPMESPQHDAPLMAVLSAHLPKVDAVIQARRRRNPWKSYSDIFAELLDACEKDARPEETRASKIAGKL